MLTFIRGYHKKYFEGQTLVVPSEKSVRLAKVFNSKNGSISPAMPSFFEVVEATSPTDLKYVKKLLEKYSKQPEIAMIRAASIASTKLFRRNAETFNCSTRSKIIHMDIDGITCPSDVTTLEEQGEHCLSLLNILEENIFPKDAAFVAKASGSAGIKKGIRVHLYLHSDKAVNNAQLKGLAKELNKKSEELFGFELLDTSVYDKVHLMYTADPLFDKPEQNPYYGKVRIVHKEGSLLNVPDNLPEYQSSSISHIKINDGLMEYVEGIEGFMDIPEYMEKSMKRFYEATDGVYNTHMMRIYADAIEQGVDISWFDSHVSKHLESYINTYGKKRSVQAYINNGKQAAARAIIGRSLRRTDSKVNITTNSGGSASLPVEMCRTDSDIKEKYLHINKLPPENKLTFIKASLGTGKTTTVQSWLKAGLVTGRFLAITNTVSLVEGNAKKLGAGVYNKLKDYNNFTTGWIEGLTEYDTKYDRMSTTIHSLHRFKDTIEKRGLDFIFIDECDAVMNDILFSDCIKEREKCISTLRLALNSAKHVILSDGDISNETMEMYARLTDPIKDVALYVHERPMLKDATAYELFDVNSIWAALQASLSIGEKCILVSDCSPKELNEKGMVLRHTTGMNVKEVHKNSTKDKDIKEILTYGNDSLKSQGVDALLCSPSVTSGVDFNYFDTIFVITRDGCIHAPNLRFQALRRDRGAKMIYYYTARETEKLSFGSEMYDTSFGWTSIGQKIFSKRRENECKSFRSSFRMLLRNQGCSVILDATKWGNLDSMQAEYTEERINAVLSATPTFQMLRHGDAFEIKEYIVKYFEDVDDIESIHLEHVEKWLELEPHKRAGFFHKIFKEFWPSIKKCKADWNYFEQELRRRPHIWSKCSGMNVGTEKWRIKRYLAAAGIKVPGEYSNIIDWYRTYCKLENHQIPEEFLTEDEKAMYLENNVEM